MSSVDTLVTAAIIRKNNNVLIAQRKKDSFLEPNKWEFPGGKIKDDERNEDCLIREIKEELGIQIRIESLFLTTRHTYEKEGKKYPIVLFSYLSTWENGKLHHLDCQDTRWVDANDIETFDFAEADIPIVKKILHENLVF